VHRTSDRGHFRILLSQTIRELDFIPFVGGAKNLAEAARGRDFIRDRPNSL
jgi:hypothetical protein